MVRTAEEGADLSRDVALSEVMSGPWRGRIGAVECSHGCPVRAGSTDSGTNRSGQVDETEFADLHLVTAGQRRGVDRLAVHIGAVERTHVVHGVAAAFAGEFSMPSGHGDIVQEDVTVRVATRRGDVLVQQKSAAGVGSTLDDEQRGTWRERVDRTLVRLG